MSKEKLSKTISEVMKKNGKIKIGNLKIIDGERALKKAALTSNGDLSDRVITRNIKPFDKLNLDELGILNDLDETIIEISASRYTWFEDRIIYKIRYEGHVYHIVIRNIGTTFGQFHIYHLTDESSEGKFEWIYEKDFDIKIVYPLFAEAFKGLSDQYKSQEKGVYYFEEFLIDTINQILSFE